MDQAVREGANRASSGMKRYIWCTTCAAAGGISIDDERGETRAVRWGYIAHPDMRCDGCAGELPAGELAAAVTHYDRPSEYLSWEAYYLMTLADDDEEVELVAALALREPEALLEKILAGGEVGRDERTFNSHRNVAHPVEAGVVRGSGECRSMAYPSQGTVEVRSRFLLQIGAVLVAVVACILLSLRLWK